MFLYELAVAENARQRGIGLAFTASLADLARWHGCYGMWVGVDTDNAAAHATYRAAGQQNRTVRRHHLDVLTNLARSTGRQPLMLQFSVPLTGPPVTESRAVVDTAPAVGVMRHPAVRLRCLPVLSAVPPRA